MKIKVSEKEIQHAILDYLRIRGYLCKRNNAGMSFGQHNGKKWAIKIGEPGWPDIEGITKDGLYFGIEVKSATGKLEESQKAIGKKIGSMGGARWFVARSVGDVIEQGL